MPPSDTDPNGVLRIATPRETAYYDTLEIDCQFPECRGFVLVKHTPERETHHVCLSLNAGESTCDCPGFLRWGHCKHVDGLRALASRGQL
jgi:hypothetical protein